MFSYDGKNGVYTDFAGFFCKPFVAVVVFCRTDRHMKSVRVCPPIISDLDDFRFCPFGRVGDYAAFHKTSFPVDDGDHVPFAVSEYFDAVCRFVRIEPAHISFDIF